MAQTKTQIVGEVINGFPVTGVVTATVFLVMDLSYLVFQDLQQLFLLT